MKDLEKQFKPQKEHATPSKEFVQDLWLKLSDESELAPNKVLFPRFFSLSKAFSVALIVLVFIGTGTYAYASPKVSEGHMLHFVKSGVERLEGQFARTSVQKASYHEKMLRRRLQEAESLTGNQNEQIPVLLERASRELDLSIEEAVKSQNDQEYKENISERLNQLHEQLIEKDIKRKRNSSEDDERRRKIKRIRDANSSELLFDAEVKRNTDTPPVLLERIDGPDIEPPSDEADRALIQKDEEEHVLRIDDQNRFERELESEKEREQIELIRVEQTRE